MRRAEVLLSLTILLAAIIGCTQRPSLEATLHWEKEPFYVGVGAVDSAAPVGLILIDCDMVVQPVNRRLQTTIGSPFFERGTFTGNDIAGAMDATHIWATCKRHDSLFVVDVSRRRWLYVTCGVDRRSPSGWDGSISNVSLRDINADKKLEAVVVVRSAFDTGGRGVYVLDWDSGRLLWCVRIGPVPHQLFLRDIDGDGQTEILLGTHAVANGDSANGTDDAQTYVMLFSADGRRLWTRPIGRFSSSLSLSWLSDSASRYPPIFVAELGSPAGDRACDSVFILDSRDGSVTARAQHGTYNQMQAVLSGAEGNMDILLGGNDDTLRLLDGRSLKCSLKTAIRGGISLSYAGWNAVSRNLAIIPTMDGRLLVVNPALGVQSEIPSGQIQIIYPVSETPMPWFLATGTSGERSLWRLYSLAPTPFLQRKVSAGVLVAVVMMLVAAFGGVLAGVRYRQTHDMRAVVRSLTGQAGILEIDSRGRVRHVNPKGRELLKLAGASERAMFAGPLAPLGGPVRPGAGPRELPLSLSSGQTLLARATPVKSGILLTLEDISTVEYLKRVSTWVPVAQKLAHDIKNPLTAISLTLQRVEKAAGPESQRYVDSMKDDIERLKKMADGFMRLTKLEPPKLAPGSVNDLVRSCLAKFDSVKPPGITFVYELADDLPSVALDRDQMAAACSNIIENSVSAMGDSGVLTIRTSLAVSRKLLAVSFSDTGKGIPERYVSKVFEPYFTLKPGGTGLGMAITKRIIEDHKGTIAIQSKEGEGTTVTIAMPTA